MSPKLPLSLWTEGSEFNQGFCIYPQVIGGGQGEAWVVGLALTSKAWGPEQY